MTTHEPTDEPAGGRAPSRLDRWDVAIGGATLVWGLAFIARASFEVDGERTFALFDDAMISMRYARNLIEGAGPVFNAGEPPVEGVTNPLWMVWMAALHVLPLPTRWMALPVQLSGLACLLATAWHARRLAEEVTAGPHARFAGVVAGVAVAGSLPLANWSLQGMEVGLVALLATAAARYHLPEGPDDPARERRGWFLLVLAMWVRIDALVLVGATWIAVALRRSLPSLRRASVGVLAALLIGYGVPALLRLAIYGQWVPNTYDLKVVGYPLADRIGSGLVWYGRFLLDWNPLWPALMAAGAWLARRRGGILLLGFFGAQSAYSVWVGGDAWEEWGGANRFLSVALPCAWALIAASVVGLVARTPLAGRLAGAAGGLALLAGLLCAAESNRTGRPLSLERWALIEPPIFRQTHRDLVRRAKRVCRLTTEEGRVAVAMAGVLPYFCPRPAIDLLGKSDPAVARGPMHLPPEGRRHLDFHPGHMKWDYAHSLGRLEPDLVAQLWDRQDALGALWKGRVPPDAAPHLVGRYARVEFPEGPLFLRLRSPRIRWGRAQREGRMGR